ncbi:hypothetical protein CRE60_000241 [Escherichia coli]|nr:hypothetical protein [Escherichia coli]EGZ7413962.1 hypothetical protein [Escherichia coli]
MLPSEIMIWQPEFTDKILSRKPGAVHCSKYGFHSQRQRQSQQKRKPESHGRPRLLAVRQR